MINVSDLYLGYSTSGGQRRRVLDGINFAIEDGERVGLMGPNGSGKTTFARCLNGLLSPSSGAVEVDDLSTTNDAHLPEIRRRVGMVFQNPENQIVSTTVEREIAFGLENLGVPRAEMHKVVADTLHKFDLARYRTHPPHRLSGGEMQRLALASVVAMSPQTIIFDEPSSYLDGAGRRQLLSLIDDLHRDQSRPKALTTLFITQYPDEVLTCDRVVILDQGKIVITGSPEEVFSQVARMESLGVDIPLEFAVNDYLKTTSDGRLLLNPSEFLPIS